MGVADGPEIPRIDERSVDVELDDLAIRSQSRERVREKQEETRLVVAEELSKLHVLDDDERRRDSRSNESIVEREELRRERCALGRERGRIDRPKPALRSFESGAVEGVPERFRRRVVERSEPAFVDGWDRE